jgi:hypothetical protein
MNHRHRSSFAQTDSPERVQIDRRMDRFRSPSFGFQALVSLALTLMAFFGVAGCSTSPAKSQSSQTPVISVALVQLPPAALPVSTSAQVSATVSNDAANAGVDWIATCGGATDCGHFAPAHTDSGAATTFWAPPAVPAHKTIAVTALSTTDHSKASAFSVTILSAVTSITINNFPPTTAAAGSRITLSATVAGDPANLGVDWKADCGGIDCTSDGFHLPHSTSGVGVSFEIPLPTQSGFLAIVGSTVTITAYAAADHGFSAIATFQVSAPLVVTITQQPPATMLTNATATVVAVVQNDLTNSGVTWNVTCSGTCGTITPQQTASGAPAVFTAPPVLPSQSSPVVQIAATAQAGSSRLPSALVDVTIVVPISVKINQGVTNGTIVQNHTASLVAAVANDTANAGVDWSVTCSSPGSCGTFSPAHTASGSATSYTAPAAIPAGGTVTITAASTSDPTKTDTQTVTVTASPPPNSLLTGKFVMLLSSNHSANGAYVIGGVISGDGNGTITNANLDLADASGNTGITIPILSPSTYSIGLDGRGQIQLRINPVALSNGHFGVNGTGAITLSVVFVTPQHATLSESDSFGTATGTLDLQNLQGFSGISPGVYSLSLSGSEVARPTAGYFVTSAVTIPSATTYSYITDQADGGVITSVPFATVSQGFANGAFSGGNLRLSSVNLGLPTQFNLNLWAIDATHFVVTDVLDSLLGTPNVIVSGHLAAQPSTPTVSGTYAFTETGATAAAQPQVAGGILTCGSTGTLDVVPLSGTALNNQAINVTCAPVTNGRSVITIAAAGSSGINQFAAYPTADQGLYLIELDGGASGTSGSSGAGVALTQTLSPPIASAALDGKYASNLSSSTALGSQAFAGQIAADGVSVLTGTADVNSFNATAATPGGTPSLGAAFSGSYSSASDGRFPITLTITPASGQPSPQITNVNLACYLVDANTCMLLDLDATAPGTGILILQNTGL